MRILLIDDSVAYREEFAELLGECAFADAALDGVGDAAAGTRAMLAGRYDICFVDYRLPGATGIELIAAARAAGVNRPIVLLTGFDSPHVDVEAGWAGANDYLAKGEFSAAMLARAIRYAMRNAASIEAARDAESRFRLAQEAADIGSWEWDLGRGLIACSPRQRALLGLDPADPAPLDAARWWQAIHPEDRAAARRDMHAVIAAGTKLDTLFRVPGADPPAPDSHGARPGPRWLAGRGLVLRGADGAPGRMIGVSVDVTAQQAALADLRASRNSAIAGLYASEARFRAYFETASDSLCHLQPTADGGFVYAAINPAALAHAGMDAAAARGRTPQEVFGPAAGGVIAAALRQVCDSDAAYRHEPIFDFGAGPLVYDAAYIPLRDDAGRIAGILGSARDISERRRFAEALHRTQQMEALSQLAAGVAHDFNNLLQAISGSVEVVLDRVDPGTSAHGFLSLALRAAERGSYLTQHLLSYTRRQILQPQAVDLPALLDDIAALLGRTLGPHIGIAVQVGAALSRPLVDPGQLQTALLNLAINAGHAMPPPRRGRLLIEAADRRVDDIAWVAVIIADTGSGMDAAVLARASEPFFSTKGTEGSGLGLSMVQGFAAQSGGRFRLSSVMGQGTTAELLLPVCDDRDEGDDRDTVAMAAAAARDLALSAA